MFLRTLPLIPAAVLLTLSALGASPAAAQQAASPPSAAARQTLERCVSGQLARLARTQTPEAQVGASVVQQCDSHLQGLLSVMIQTGEAPCPTVASCLQIARDRMAQEAYSSYSQRVVAAR
jgi:hypothetical protein